MFTDVLAVGISLLTSPIAPQHVSYVLRRRSASDLSYTRVDFEDSITKASLLHSAVLYNVHSENPQSLRVPTAGITLEISLEPFTSS